MVGESLFSYKTALLPKTDISYIYHFLEEKHFYKKNLVVEGFLLEVPAFVKVTLFFSSFVYFLDTSFLFVVSCTINLNDLNKKNFYKKKQRVKPPVLYDNRLIIFLNN